MIYSFYDPDLAARKGLGTFIILDHILRARTANLPYVYLGYWIEGCDRMRYKVRFQPAEQLTSAGWRPRSARPLPPASPGPWVCGSATWSALQPDRAGDAAFHRSEEHTSELQS